MKGENATLESFLSTLRWINKTARRTYWVTLAAVVLISPLSIQPDRHTLPTVENGRFCFGNIITGSGAEEGGHRGRAEALGRESKGGHEETRARGEKEKGQDHGGAVLAMVAL